MRRTVASAALVLGLVAAVFLMREATQNRPDPVVDGSETTVDFTVSTSRFSRGEPAAATALWAVCSATVSGDVTPVPVAHADGWRVHVTPAIGEHGENRLVGCLEDLTVDRVVGDVVAITSRR